MSRHLVATLCAAFVCLGAEVAASCPTYTPGEEVGVVQDARIDEASGLARSWRNEGLFWVHNDSGDSARLFLIDLNGTTHAEVLVDGVKAVDWEDVAVGPCAADAATPCVWVGDIGDNRERRDDITLYRFEEPTLPDPPPEQLHVTADAFPISYRGGARNAETLMVHPQSGAIYIVDKTNGAPSKLWHVHLDGQPATAVGEFAPGELGLFANRVTAGDFAPHGGEFSIRTYTHVYTFCGDDPVVAFSTRPRVVAATSLAQAEALTYAADGKTLYTTSEVRDKTPPPILAMQQVAAPPRAKNEESPVRRPTRPHVDRRPGCSCSVSAAPVPMRGGALAFAALAAAAFRRRRPRR